MLAAKAIQDWRLYSGQEASTRYVDFSEQVFLNPVGNKKGEAIQEAWRKFYLKAQLPVQAHLKKQFIKKDSEDEKIYEKAIVARAFDITRAFLPAGATTNVAWRMNFRQFADELMLLRHHPLIEVRDIAEKTEQALQKAFPSSFGHLRFEITEKYNKEWMQESYYYKNPKAKDFSFIRNDINSKDLKVFKKILKNRPMKTELPPTIATLGMVHYEFLLDFGSFRDLQRHRAVAQRMPLLTRKHGFNDWYLGALPEKLRKEAVKFIASQTKKIDSLKISEEEKQYYTAMGYNVPCKFSGDLKALIYLAELRSTRFVHPTLVRQILKVIDSLNKLFKKDGLIIHVDDEPNRFDIRRGEQDIVIK
jgi:thymidylate synthase ThyX